MPHKKEVQRPIKERKCGPLAGAGQCGAFAEPAIVASAFSRPVNPRFWSASFSAWAMSTFSACTLIAPICGLSPSEKLPSTFSTWSALTSLTFRNSI